MQTETCAGCDYLSVCHGGCPVRTYAITGDFYKKDPYCHVYKSLFTYLDALATKVSAAKYRRSLPVLPAFAAGNGLRREVNGV